MTDIGEEMFQWATDLFPIPRSLTGNGVRKTLSYFKDILPELRILEIPSGQKRGDWTVPEEWNVREASIRNAEGRVIADFEENNLHLVGYSAPFRGTISKSELENHLYSLPDQPDAIPYVTSYYEKRWGFCISHHARQELGEGPFEIVVDTEFTQGSLTYGELFIAGNSDKEILLSTYICHPSMANNELSGPVVAAALARWLQELNQRKYSYRILFLPETIGPIIYLDEKRDHLKEKVIAGWVLTCMGDERTFSFLPSRLGNTVSDRVSEKVLTQETPGFVRYSFLDRGSDERQWCYPGVDLPVCSIMRSKYGTYPEYHTSLDNLSLISPRGLAGSLDVMKKCLEILESEIFWRATTVGEPQMGRRGLYPTVSQKHSARSVRDLMNVLVYCDGVTEQSYIGKKTGLPNQELEEILSTLAAEGLISE